MTKRHIPLVAIAMLAVLLLIFSTASADMSTNLRIDAVKSPTGLLLSETYVNDAGDPVIASDKGYATIKYSYGTGKTVTGIELLDTEGNLINGAEGYARIANVYNGKTRIEQRYYDKDGDLVNGPQGYARQETKGLWSDMRSTWEYDQDGNPVNLHRITEYTSYGQYRLITSDSWYDTEDKLAAGPDGYARVENEYLGASVTKTAYLDKNGKPYYNAKAGYATLVREFEKSVERSLNYYGTKGERIPGPDGYSYAVFSYRNGIKRSMWYNVDGTLWYNNKGICGNEIAKNYRGQVVEEYYFTGENQRGRSTDGYSGVNRKFSKYRQLAMEKYLDENNKQMVVEKLGYARVLNTISDRTLKTREEYYDENNKPTINANGYSIAVHKYEHAQLMESNYYDTDGKTPVNIKDGYARVTYERDEENNVVRTNWYDAEGNPCPGPSGVEEVRNTWDGKNKASESYWKANGNPDKGPDGVNAIQMEYNGAGKVTKKTLLGAGNRVTAGKDGYAIVETEYNSDGGVMCVKYYDADGRLMLAPGKEYAYERTVLMKDLGAMGKDEGEDEEGIAEGEEGEEAEEEEAPDEGQEDEELEITEEIEENSADEERETAESTTDGNAEEKAQEGVKGSIIEYYGIDGQLMTLKAGYAIIERKNNSAGKVAEESYYSADREPVTQAAGYAKIEREYDGFNALSNEAYFGMNGEPVTLAAGYQYFTRANDNKGNALKTAYFDAEGKPVINSSIKAHRVDKAYLDAKHVLSEAWFDTAGKACVSTDTYAKIEREFDRNGNTISEKTFGTNGQAICRNAGYDETQWMYNEKNQVIQIQYRNDARLTEDVNGVAVIQRKYDDAGNIAEEWYLDRTGLATTSQKTKYHRIEKEYLDAKHVISEKYYDAWGKPTTAGDTFVQIRREFDEKGNTIRECTYGPFRRPIARNAGYDELRNTFNEKNQVVKIEYLLGGSLVIKNDGIAIIEREYDDKGCIAVESYYGTSGEPVLLSGKYHKIVREWMDSKHATSEAWFDTEGQPITNGDTFVQIKRTFDAAGNTLTEVTCDAAGQPIARNAGYDEVRNTFNEKNQVVKIEYLLGGNLVIKNDGIAVIEREYDDKGCIAVESYYGTSGEPVLLNGKYHKIVREWLDSKHATSEAWFDTEGQPITNGDTFVQIKRTFDAAGNTLTEVTCDADGQSIERNAGYDEVRNTFNEKNQVVKIEYLLGGNLVIKNDGIAVIEREYDDKGCIAVESYYGTSGQPVLLSGNKYHKIVREWLDSKHATSEAWFDTEGLPMPQGDTFVQIKRTFDAAGNTLTEVTCDGNRQPIARNAGYDEQRNTFNEKNQVVKIEYLLGGNLVIKNDGIAVIEREYDDKGCIAVESYYGTSGEPVLLSGKYHKIVRTWMDAKHATSEAWFDTEGQPITNGDTFVQIKRTFDAAGNTLTEVTCDAAGQPIARNAGYDEQRNTFNEKNQVIKIEYLLGGNLVIKNDGIAVIEREYDDKGCIAVESYYGTSGEPVLLSGNKYHKIVRTWLDAKHATSEAWFDTKGQPMPQGDTFAQIKRTFDAARNTLTEVTCDGNGQPIARNAGYDEVRNTFNEKNQVVKIEYLLGGNLVNKNDGIAVIEREYDDKGLVAVESYYGTSGEPVLLNGNKYQKIMRTWMDSKHATSEAWFDVDGQPMTQGDTFVRIDRQFDENGNTVDEITYGADGQPIARKAGYDEQRNTFNEKNQAVKIEYLLGGKPVLNSDGVAIIEREYDEAGLVSVECYFGTTGEPVLLNGNKYHRIDRTWLDKKHATSEAWFDVDGHPMTQGDTFVRIDRQYDENGNTIDEITYGEDGQPIARKAGYDEVRNTFNEKNQAVKIEYLLGGQPVLNSDGVAIITREYDEAGLITVESYYGTENEPVMLTGKNKYHRIERTWLDKKHATSEAWFGTDGQPITLNNTYVRVERTFDEAGNCTDERYFGADGAAIACNAGYDEVRNTFNEKNQAIKIEYLLGGAPVLNSDGVATVEREFDEAGLVAVESYYGTEGEPIALTGKNKYHRIERTWMDSKHATSEAWFDVGGQPMALRDTYVKVEREFDEKGNCTEERYYGADGKPIACKAGYDTLKQTFNNKNQAIEISYFLDGAPYTVKNKYAMLEREYDDAGNVSVERYFDGDRKPVLCRQGYAEIRMGYNDKKQVIRESWFDTEGKPMTNGDTYYGVEKEYDEAGNVSVTRLLDAEWQPTACQAGYEMVWKRYNEKKQNIYESYMDHTGAPMKNNKGVYQTTYDYNENGKVIQEQYLDENGQLMKNSDGYVRVIRTWNEDGSLASEEGREE